MNYQDMAALSLQGLPLDREQCHSVLHCPQDSILELLQAAFMVRKQYFGNKVILQLLINAKSGLCTEDCAYCSQSGPSEASIDRYPILDAERIITGAFTAKSSHAKRYCIVASGLGPSQEELEHICQTVSRIRAEVDVEICTSLGLLSEEDAQRLKEAGVDRYNHNLNTSERFYPQICTTHNYKDRINTLQNARKAGLKLCCGALFGMGESDDDIIDLGLALREVGPDSIPVNFLHPIQGTSLEQAGGPTPLECLCILCLMRFLNPCTEIRVAGGRELRLRSLQPLLLYPANSVFVSGYLSTDGQGPKEALQMIADMGFMVEEEAVDKVSAA